jgi:arsenical pump membrane protein
MLFSSQLPPHPQALLIGLDLGPNLATFGAMSSLLWLRISRAEGASPSAVTFCRVGIVLAPVSIAAASFISQHLVIGKF